MNEWEEWRVNRRGGTNSPTKGRGGCTGERRKRGGVYYWCEGGGFPECEKRGVKPPAVGPVERKGNGGAELGRAEDVRLGDRRGGG